ncbi:hypothetical protein ONS95_013493 [Cadophora gregata]|uniref:uncharacterized protein n=1 Tax=Cadophora gregata TaxID=51156 RepID=UPI0026DD1638|nr:uncharacterized protein ONS95_013493 [Cadophora gregata]KAK0099610.1 hypothetical protein ONS96_008110 [Cadophora gregata f. sp. sojae]KAK0116479.1 hypothetical protein ONS95_013493 [Cadophora gregata]
MPNSADSTQPEPQWKCQNRRLDDTAFPVASPPMCGSCTKQYGDQQKANEKQRKGQNKKDKEGRKRQEKAAKASRGQKEKLDREEREAEE